MHLQKITIVGPGLIGGSIGLALKKAGFTGQLVGCARKQQTLDTAIKARCIDTGSSDLIDACREAALIVLCTPVSTLAALLEKVGQIAPDAVITDAGSTKQSITEASQQVLADAGRFVGSHPMAGNEKTGPEAATATLFENKLAIITPTDQTNPDALQLIKQLWQTLGMNIAEMDAGHHDRLVATVSHLPHALAALLVTLADDEALSIASTGFADTTRIAAGDPGLWTDILLDNKDAVLEEIGHYTTLLNGLKNKLKKNDADRIHAFLENASQKRQQWKPRQ